MLYAVQDQRILVTAKFDTIFNIPAQIPSDMKSGFCTSGDWVDCTDFIFMFLGLDWVCTLRVDYVHYIRLFCLE